MSTAGAARSGRAAHFKRGGGGRGRGGAGGARGKRVAYAEGEGVAPPPQMQAPYAHQRLHPQHQYWQHQPQLAFQSGGAPWTGQHAPQAQQVLLEGTMTYASRCPHCRTDNYMHSDPNTSIIKCVSCSRAYGKPEHPGVKVLQQQYMQMVTRLADADSRAYYAHQEVNYFKGLLVTKEEQATRASSPVDASVITQGIADMKKMLQQFASTARSPPATAKAVNDVDTAALQAENDVDTAALQAENADLHAEKTKLAAALAAARTKEAKQREARDAAEAKQREADAAQAKQREADAAEAKQREARLESEVSRLNRLLADLKTELGKARQDHQQHAARSTARVRSLMQEKEALAASAKELGAIATRKEPTQKLQTLHKALAESEAARAHAGDELRQERADAEQAKLDAAAERDALSAKLTETEAGLTETGAKLVQFQILVTKLRRTSKQAVTKALAEQQTVHQEAMRASAKVVAAKAIEEEAKHGATKLQGQIDDLQGRFDKLTAQHEEQRAAHTAERRELLTTMKQLHALQAEHKKLQETSMLDTVSSKNLVDSLRKKIKDLCSWSSDQEEEGNEDDAQVEGDAQVRGGMTRPKTREKKRRSKAFYRARPQTLEQWSKRASDAEDSVRLLNKEKAKLAAELEEANSELTVARASQVAKNVQLNTMQTVLREIGAFVQTTPTGKTRKKVGGADCVFPTMSSEDILQTVRKTVSTLRTCVEMAMQFVSRMLSYTHPSKGEYLSVSLDISSPEASLKQMNAMLQNLTKHELMFVAQHTVLRNTTFVFEPRQMDVLGDVLFATLGKFRSFLRTVDDLWASGKGVANGKPWHVAVTTYQCLGSNGSKWNLTRSEGMALLFVDTRIDDIRRDWPMCLASLASAHYTRDHVQSMLLNANGHLSAVLDSLFRGCSYDVQTALTTLFNGMCLRVAAENSRVVDALSRASVAVQKALIANKVPESMKWAMFGGKVEYKTGTRIRTPTRAEIRNKLTKHSAITLTDLVNSLLFAGRLAQHSLYSRLDEQGLESVAGAKNLSQVFDIVTRHRTLQLGKEAGAVFARNVEGGSVNNAGCTRVSQEEFQQLQTGGPNAFFELLSEETMSKLGFTKTQDDQAADGTPKRHKIVVDLGPGLGEEAVRRNIRKELSTLGVDASEAVSIASQVARRSRLQIDNAPQPPNELHVYLQSTDGGGGGNEGEKGGACREGTEYSVAFVVATNPKRKKTTAGGVSEEEEAEGGGGGADETAGEEESAPAAGGSTSASTTASTSASTTASTSASTTASTSASTVASTAAEAAAEGGDEEQGMDISDLLPEGCEQLHVVHASGLVPSGFRSVKASQLKDVSASLSACGGSLQPAQLITAIRGSESLRPTRPETVREAVHIQRQVDSTINEMAAKAKAREDNAAAVADAVSSGDTSGIMRVLAGGISTAFDEADEACAPGTDGQGQEKGQTVGDGRKEKKKNKRKKKRRKRKKKGAN